MNRKGFTLIEMILGLLLSTSVISLLTLSFKTLNFNSQQHLISDVNARIQLTQTLQYYQHISIDHHEVILTNSLIGKPDQKIVFNNQKIYVTPGVNILMSDIENAQFSVNGNIFTLSYKKGGHSYQYEKQLP